LVATATGAAQSPQEKARIDYEIAKKSLAAGDAASALKRFQSVLAVLGPLPELHFLAGKAAAATGDLVTAKKHIEGAFSSADAEFKKSANYQALIALSVDVEMAVEKQAKEKAAAQPSAQGAQPTGQTFTNSQGMTMVKIPRGTFEMGSENGASDEQPVHTVTISRDFWMGKTPVTQAQWQAVMGGNPSDFKGDNLPVEQVSWGDAQAFIESLNAMGGKWTYRLPYEAEWEYACKAGTTGQLYGPLNAIAWYEGNSGGKTHPVGQKQANAFGLYDMIGNVWQWCQDYYGTYPSGPVTDPKGGSDGSLRVLRGGSWNYSASHCRAAYRSGHGPSLRDLNSGFRVVCSPARTR